VLKTCMNLGKSARFRVRMGLISEWDRTSGARVALCSESFCALLEGNLSNRPLSGVEWHRWTIIWQIVTRYRW
jgi:hypothetical protein